MTKPIYLLLGIHNHQPVGNFGSVFSEAFEKCYWPLLKLLEKYPEVKIALHHSGPLLDWATEHELSYIPTLASLVSRGQVEILGGGYYEPILTILKQKDASGQINMMQDFWIRATGEPPQGMWLAERVWEPSLAKLIADEGLKYTILDDEHFRYAGLPDDTLFNYYRTERAGSSIAVFPTDKTMRYLIPFKPVEDVIAHLLNLRQKNPGCAITYGDDGEKFGMWPGTFEWVIKKGWLEKFFQALTEYKNEIVTTHFSKFLAENKAAGTTYLPTASYNEMLEWAMPAKSIVRYEDVKKRMESCHLMDLARPFMRGGLWDNFLSKYSESNVMHKRSIFVSNRIDLGEKDYDLSNARRALYRAQCNCAYWHGLFGGLYLNYLRHAVYTNLIEAENIVDEALYGKKPFLRSELVDLNCDGENELVMASQKLLLTTSPLDGGSIIDLSWRPAKFNIQNTLARRFEAYHSPSKYASHHEVEGSDIPSIHNIAKDIKDAVRDLKYDSLPRYSFLEHIITAGSDKEVLKKLSEPSASFGNQKFTVVSHSQNENEITARLETSIENPFKEGETITLFKTYHLQQEKFLVDFELKGNFPEQAFFVTELNLTLLAENDPKRYYMWGDSKPGQFMMNTSRQLNDLNDIALVDEHFKIKINIQTSENALWNIGPVNTVSQSESGFDKFYQGSNICILVKPKFGEDGIARFSANLFFEHIES